MSDYNKQNPNQPNKGYDQQKGYDKNQQKPGQGQNKQQPNKNYNPQQDKERSK